MPNKKSLTPKKNTTKSNSEEQFSSVIDAFFANFNLQECQTEIWKLLIGYAESNHNDSRTEITLSNTLYFCRNLDLLLNGLHIARQTSLKPAG
ncbi:MAG: hypothetical protein WCF67_08730 [Chitinophagaceae bacterium]